MHGFNQWRTASQRPPDGGSSCGRPLRAWIIEDDVVTREVFRGGEGRRQIPQTVGSLTKPSAGLARKRARTGGELDRNLVGSGRPVVFGDLRDSNPSAAGHQFLMAKHIRVAFRRISEFPGLHCFPVETPASSHGPAMCIGKGWKLRSVEGSAETKAAYVSLC